MKIKKPLLTLLFLFFTLPAFAQETPPFELEFNRAHQNYLGAYNLYLEAHKEYLIAKNQAQTYQTLTAQTLALEQTIKMLEARDEVIATFLIALRAQLSRQTNIATYKLNSLYLQLEKEINWYLEHQSVFSSAGTLPDLFKLSAETEKRYPQTQVLFYQVPLQIFLHQEDLLHQKIQTQIDQTEALIAQIRTAGDKNTSQIERWLLEAKNKKNWAEEKFAQAQAIQITSQGPQKQLNQAKKSLQESRQYLKETNLHLIEILKEIKRGD